MNCINCDNSLSEGAKFCGECGAAVKMIPKKEKFLSVSGESIFGMRFIKTPKAKIITGILMLALAIVCISDPDLNDMSVFIAFLIVGGIWYVYKGIKNKNLLK